MHFTLLSILCILPSGSIPLTSFKVSTTVTMRLFDFLLATCLCLAQTSLAVPLSFTKWPTTLRAGQPSTVTWTGDLETVRVVSSTS